MDAAFVHATATVELTAAGRLRHRRLRRGAEKRRAWWADPLRMERPVATTRGALRVLTMSRPRVVSRPRVPAWAPGSDSAESLPLDTPISGVGARDPCWRGHLLWLRASIARRYGADLADDLAQETYLRVVQRTGTEPIGNFRGLLMAVATNLARDTFRRRRVRADHASQAAGLAESSETHTAEDDLRLREAIMMLPPDLRDTFLQSKIGGLTNREIAQRCGLSVRAIDKRLQKAVTLLVTQLRD